LDGKKDSKTKIGKIQQKKKNEKEEIKNEGHQKKRD